MEKWNNPFFDKVVGLPKEQEHLGAAWEDYIVDNVRQIGGRKIENFEIEKSAEDIGLIEAVDASVDKILSGYGRNKTITIPLDNIHLLKDGGTQEYTKKFAAAARSSVQQSIIIDRCISDVQFSIRLFHELVHIKSYTALQTVSTNNKRALAPYRTGVAVHARDGNAKYLGDIEEAIVGYLTSKYYENIVSKDSRFENEIHAIDESKSSVDLSRQKELQKLYKIIDRILLNEKTVDGRREDILNLFIEAQLNGNLMQISRLICHAYGIESVKDFDTLES